MDLATLHEDVVFGRTNGQIIWQPRILCWYEDKKFSGDPFPAEYAGLSLEAVYRKLGCSDRLYRWYNPCFVREEHPGVRRSETQLNATDRQVTIKTPVGRQVEVVRRSLNSPRDYRLKWEVETEAELKVATWREEQVTWVWDQAGYEHAVGLVGDLGAPTVYLPRMNVQDLYLNKLGVEKGVYALYDWPETTEAYFQALEESHNRLIDVINDSPIKIINFGENVHAGTLSPPLFQKYHLPACQRRCERLHSAGKFVSAHWDGNCGPLLPFARETGLDGIEAITPAPQGDVTLAEIMAGLGDEMILLDGIPAIYFDAIYPEEVLLACVEKLIELFAPRLVLGISDELSSTGDIKRVRRVGELVESYNACFA